jgi:uncharacterized protein (UPF0264 family)
VPDRIPLSAALGDPIVAERVRRAVARCDLPIRDAPFYAKLGFAGQLSVPRVTGLIEAALAAAAGLAARPIVVPVAYADHGRAGVPAPEQLLRAAMETGARALLIDTHTKDGRGLLDWLDLEAVHRLSERARAAGLLFALAGSLQSAAVTLLAGSADVIGVRGAVCRGGRAGVVDAELVRRLVETTSAASERMLAG